jgi:hypothetical protein
MIIERRSPLIIKGYLFTSVDKRSISFVMLVTGETLSNTYSP